MIDYVSILKENPNGILATQDNGKVKTRIFQYLFSEGNKVYFCTSNEKSVYRQLKSNPQTSFCTYPPDFSLIVSINGEAAFTDDMGLKTRALEENPGIKGIYGSSENPTFELFYLNITEVETFSFAEGKKTYAF